MKSQIEKFHVKMLALVLGIAGAQAAPAQTFKNVPAKGGAALVQVSSGGASVWALTKSGKPYIYQNKQFVLANGITLKQIAVGGGSKFQADTVWGLNSAGNVYKGSGSGTTWTFTEIAGTLDFIAVGAGTTDKCHPYEVWGVNTATHIFRYNFCNNDFDQIAGLLTSVAVGGGDIWGLNSSEDIFRYNFSTGAFDAISGTLSQIAVGPNSVWGINSASHIFEFYDNTQEFSQLTGALADIQAGGEGVWGLNSAQAIFRLEPSTSTFVQVPGSLVSLSVGSGGGVWGINSSGHAYAFSTP
jgi:virginiamycin B lyase